ERARERLRSQARRGLDGRRPGEGPGSAVRAPGRVDARDERKGAGAVGRTVLVARGAVDASGAHGRQSAPLDDAVRARRTAPGQTVRGTLGTREARQRDPHRGHRRNPDHLVTIGEPRGGVNTFEPNYRFEVPNGPTPRCAGALTISLGCAVSWRRALLASKRPCSLDQETLLTFAACRPFG